MSGGLFFNQVQYHRTILALFVQCCPRKLLAQCWPKAHRHTIAGKPNVSNMSEGLFFNQVQYHRTFLALFVQCCLGSSFTTGGTTLNRGRHWLEQNHVVSLNNSNSIELFQKNKKRGDWRHTLLKPSVIFRFFTPPRETTDKPKLHT